MLSDAKGGNNVMSFAQSRQSRVDPEYKIVRRGNVDAAILVVADS